MKYLYTFLGLLVGVGLVIGGTVIYAVSASPTNFGGTGTSTPSGILYGDNGATTHLNTVTIGSGCTFITGTLSCAGTGGGGTFPFTPQSYGVSTSTTVGFLNGLFSTASSTFGGSFYLPALSTGCLQTGVGGVVTSTGSGCGSSTGLSSYDAWTHPFTSSSATTSTMYFPGIDLSASSTVGSTLNFPLIKTSFLGTDGAGKVYGFATSSIKTSQLTNDAGWTTNTGTVTSVAATVPSIFSISGSPITTSGTLAMTYSGTALPILNGGTGLTAVGASSTALMSNGSSMAWDKIATSQLVNDSGFITGNQTVTLTGAVSGSGATAITTSYAGMLGNTLGGTGQDSHTWNGIAGINAGVWSALSTTSLNASITGNAGTVTNGVYTTDTGTVTNTMLAGSIANTKLSNSTISGIALGGNLLNLSPDNTTLNGTQYNGSTQVTNWRINLANTNTWTVLQNFLYSSTTGYASFANASSTLFNVGTLTLGTSTVGCLNVSATGNVYSATCSGGGSGGGIGDPFTHTSVWGQTTSATSTLLALTGSPFSLVASSTAVFTNASSTQLTTTGQTVLATASGNVGIGTTTPFAQLSINPVAGTAVTTPDFVVGSSSATMLSYNSRASGDILDLSTTSSAVVGSSLAFTNTGMLGLGTTTPFALLSVVNFLGAGQPLFALASSSTVGSAMPVLEYDKYGHPITSGPKPTISSCGTGSPSVAGNDENMTITTGTGAPTECTGTFANTWPAGSTVVCNPTDTSSVTSSLYASTTVTTWKVGMSAALTSGTFTLSCSAYQ
jgi:hypothetical protein